MFRALATLTILLATLAPAQAADLPANSKITAVTVFADRAAVTRTLMIELPAGASTVVIDGLPQSLLTDSLRADGQASTSVTLGAIESKLMNSAELSAPRERELSSKIEALTDQRALINADQQALEQKKQFLTSLAEQASLRTRENIAAIELKPEQWQAAAASISTGVGETLRALANKGVELRQLDAQIEALQAELNGLSTGAKSAYQIRIPLEAKQATQLTAHITYQVPNASWSPIYDARLDTTSGKLNLSQFGEVRQQTGEDWNGVALNLSTAQPARNATLPELSPMWVSLYIPRPEMAANRMAVMDSMEASGSMQKLAAAPIAAMAPAPMAMEEATFVPATLKTGGYVTEYSIAGPSDVLADGTAKKVMIDTLDVSSTLIAKVSPQMDTQAYLIAQTKLGGDAPVLAGKASLFRDGAFIGSADLPLLRPQEETDLSFGVDDQISVKHTVVKDESGESGLISTDSTRIRITKTEVQNLHRTPVTLQLVEVIPVAQNEDIKLRLLDDQTRKDYEKDVQSVTGQLRWTLPLAPAQKESVSLGWMLSWPKGQTLTGLPF